MVNVFVNVKKSTVCFLLVVLVFVSISKIIFNKVYLTSKEIVDEEFHIPLGLSYCHYQYNNWDPKVTTLPGLYLISSFVLGPFEACTVYWLRFVSLTASFINVFLFYLLFSKHDKNEWRNILSSVTLALLPPLYFFSHLYYTDIVALTMILFMFVMSEYEAHYFASTCGFYAVLCRQTNVVWVALLSASYLLIELFKESMTRYISTGNHIPVKYLWHFAMQLMRRPRLVLLNLSLEFWLNFGAYVTVILSFFLFVYVNGSITVGDKNAHTLSLHVPQLFYFSLFCLIFAWPHFVGEVINFITFANRHKKLISTCILVGLFIVFINTSVHPYMLADNRHYVFYIWNRFYGKYAFFRYLMVPVYVFSWYVIIKILYDKNDITFLVLYLPCVAVVLITQQLIDVRYYFVPYILFRYRIKNTATTVFNLILEFVTFLVINTITFNLFFTKAIMWDNYDIPQRLIW